MGRKPHPLPKRIPFFQLAVNIRNNERSLQMNVVYWAFKAIEVVFYLSVIVFIIGRWNK
jgi:hypothetical protein